MIYKIFQTIVIGLLLLSCSNSNSNLSKERLIETNLLHLNVEDSLFIYTLLYTNSYENGITFLKLGAKNKDSGDQFFESYLNINLPSETTSNIILKDINFDGLNDIQLPNYIGQYNTSYSFWIYNESLSTFVHQIQLDSIYNPKFNPNLELVCSNYHIGISDYYHETFFWKNDTLILKEKFEEKWSDIGKLTVTKLLKSNEYVTKDSIIFDKFVENLKCHE